MTKEDYIFYSTLKKKLREALLNHSLTVSAAISAGGGSKSYTYTSEAEMQKALDAVEAKLCRVTCGGGIPHYPRFFK